MTADGLRSDFKLSYAADWVAVMINHDPTETFTLESDHNSSQTADFGLVGRVPLGGGSAHARGSLLGGYGREVRTS